MRDLAPVQVWYIDAATGMPDIAGETRHSLDINVQDVQFLGQRGDSGGQQQVAQEYETAEVELPF